MAEGFNLVDILDGHISNIDDKIERKQKEVKALDKEKVKANLNIQGFYEGELGVSFKSTNGKGWTENILCPFHNEKNPSFGVNLTTGAYKCHSCSAKGDIFRFLTERKGITFKEALKEISDKTGIDNTSIISVKLHKEDETKRTPTERYIYTDADGNELYSIMRFDNPKEFRPFCGGEWKLPEGIEKVPYRLPELEKAGRHELIFVVEGEKDVETIRSFGFLATTKANASGDWTPEFCEKYFYDKSVIIIPDNDSEGMRKAETSWQILKDSKACHAVDLLDKDDFYKDMPEKSDITDWCDIITNDLETLSLNLRKGMGIYERVQQLTIDTIMNTEPEPRDWILQDLIFSDAVALITGAGGVGKSFLTLNMAISIAGGINIPPFFPSRPRRVLLLNVEDSRNDIHIRMRACLGFLHAEGIITEEDIEVINKNLIILPGKGEIGGLMSLDIARNATPSIDGQWYSDKLKALKPDVVFLDTKARLYGLDENDNDHASRWMAFLEKAALREKITTIIIGHTGKSNGENNESGLAARGASALACNARMAFDLYHLNAADAKQIGIENEQMKFYFKFLVTKNSQSPVTGDTFIFARGRDGVPYLHADNAAIKEEKKKVVEDNYEQAKKVVIEAILAIPGQGITITDMTHNKTKNPILDRMISELKTDFGYSRAKRKEILNRMVDEKELEVIKNDRNPSIPPRFKVPELA